MTDKKITVEPPQWKIVAVFDPENEHRFFVYTVGAHELGLPELYMVTQSSHEGIRRFGHTLNDLLLYLRDTPDHNITVPALVRGVLMSDYALAIVPANEQEREMAKMAHPDATVYTVLPPDKNNKMPFDSGYDLDGMGDVIHPSRVNMVMPENLTEHDIQLAWVDEPTTH